jgi:epoxyqueuosine reductase
MLPAAILKQRALEFGFDLVGIAPAEADKDSEFFAKWIKQGYGGEMRYLENPRREDPRRVLPSVKSIICVGLIYNAPYPYSIEASDPEAFKNDEPPSDASQNPPRGWISRYAWGRDYHKVMRKKLEQLRAAIERLEAGVETRVYVDTGPILERAFARLSGMGWVGKNTCLINEQKGSWFFLGVILTSLELAPDVPAPDRCGSCTRCLEACPSGALTEPYVMDASRCIAYFNIELRGAIPEEFRPAIGNNVFGCDICQDACPWNSRSLSVVSGPLQDAVRGNDHSGESRTQRAAAATFLPEFQPLQVEFKSEKSEASADVKATTVRESNHPAFSLFNPTLEQLASLTEVDFKRAFAHSPIKRTKYRGWLRNLCVAMGNSGDQKFIPWLEIAAGSSDSIVSEHATWALSRLRDNG